MFKRIREMLQRMVNREPQPETLPDLQLEVTIQTVLDLCKQQGRRVSIPHGTGDVYAYPGVDPLEMHYGVNGGRYGYCILQGVEHVDPRRSWRRLTGNPQ